MDTIIWLINNHQVYVGDFYKGELKPIPFEKADSWEVYGADDLEKLVDYMNYPLHYNQFKKSNFVILFDEIKYYEMLKKIKKCFRYCKAIAIRRLNPFLIQALIKLQVPTQQVIEFGGKRYEYRYEENKGILLEACLEEEEENENDVKVNPIDLYKIILDLIKQEEFKLQSVEEAFKYDLILSPTTLYTNNGQKEKCYLQVEDVLLKETLVANESILQKGEAIFKYKHQVQKMFGRVKIEERCKNASRTGKIYFIKELDDNHLVWALKDEVIGILGEEESTYETIIQWYETYKE